MNNQPNRVRTSIYLDAELYSQLEAIAEADALPVASVIRSGLRVFLHHAALIQALEASAKLLNTDTSSLLRNALKNVYGELL